MTCQTTRQRWTAHEQTRSEQGDARRARGSRRCGTRRCWLDLHGRCRADGERHHGSRDRGASTGGGASAEALHGLEQLQHAGVRAQRRHLDHGGPDQGPVGCDAREAPAVRVRVHQYRRGMERRHGRVRPARSEHDAVSRRPAGGDRPRPRERAEVRALRHPGISPALLDADLPVYGAPGCTTGDLAVQPLQQGDYWGFGHRIDFAKPCAQKYIDSIADLYADPGESTSSSSTA